MDNHGRIVGEFGHVVGERVLLNLSGTRCPFCGDASDTSRIWARFTGHDAKGNDTFDFEVKHVFCPVCNGQLIGTWLPCGATVAVEVEAEQAFWVFDMVTKGGTK